MDERIKEHLKHLQRYQLHLRDFQRIPQEQFINDDIGAASAERFLHLSIESCLNIGNRLISILQFEMPVETPETYADIFAILFKINILKKALSEKMILMAKFRNRLVHLYWDIDRRELYRIIQEDIDDFSEFQNAIVEFLKKRNSK
jgi:uncharacterized protein YutE (UPF0331/DUF86 family)